jgi:hypothetical protein
MCVVVMVVVALELRVLAVHFDEDELVLGEGVRRVLRVLLRVMRIGVVGV